ncbi:MAG: hypothetical protein OHK0039_35170 [Bacteroidia bacterium]
MYYSDHATLQGKLSRDLQALATAQFGQKIEDAKVQQMNYKVQYKCLTEVGSLSGLDTNRLSLQMLFLDFLQDLRHSPVFRLSPHYDKLMTVIRENAIFDSLTKMLEYYYHKENSQTHAGTSTDIRGSSENEVRTAHESWLDALMRPEMTKMVTRDGWFQFDIEQEIADRTKHSKYELTKQQLNNIVAWLTNRFQFVASTMILINQHQIHGFFLIWGPVVLCLTYLSLMRFSVSDDPKWLWGWLIFIAITYGLFAICAVFKFDPLPLRSKGRATQTFSPVALAHLLSPRLVITLIITWSGTSLLDDQIVHASLLLILLPYVSITALYLSREIKKTAPDLTEEAIAWRIAILLVATLVVTFGVGIVGLDIRVHWIEVGETADLLAIASDTTYLTPLVAFTAIFLELVFKDKRVTGY